MKNFKFIIAVLIIFTSNYLNAQVEKVAKEVLEAYKTKNVDLLKKNASGILKFAISESYFNDASVHKDTKPVNTWDGNIKEIRYNSAVIMGNTVYVSYVYFSDNVENANKINVVILSSTNKQKWVMMGSGIGVEDKDVFEKMDLEISDNKKKENHIFSTEMADGSIIKNVTEQKIIDCVNKLNDDNFFFILNKDDVFMQAAYSDKGYDVQYKENGKMFEADKVLSKEKAISIFKKYFIGDDSWKTEAEWANMR